MINGPKTAKKEKVIKKIQEASRLIWDFYITYAYYYNKKDWTEEGRRLKI